MHLEQWSLAKKTVVLVAVPVVLQVVFVSVAMNLWMQAERVSDEVGRAKDINLTLHKLQKSCGDTTAVCVLARATNYRFGVDKANANIEKFKAEFSSLRGLLANDASLPEWQALSSATDDIEEIFRMMLGETEAGHIEGSVINSLGLERVRVFADAVARLSAIENSIEGPSIQHAEMLHVWLRLVLLSLFAASSLLAFGLVALYSKSITRRIANVVDNTTLMAERLPLKLSISGSDEIAALDTLLHEVDSKLDSAMRNERQVIANAADIVMSLTRAGLVQSVNSKALRQITGRNSSDVLGFDVADLIEEQWRAGAKQDLMRAVDSQNAVQFECLLVAVEGSLIPTAWSVHWSALDQTLFCVVHDARREKQVEHLRKDFLACMHKELHEPLNTVLASLQRLADEPDADLSTRARKDIGHAQQSINRLLGLVEDLLQVEAVRPGHVALTLAVQDVRALVTETVYSLEAFAGAHGIAVENDVEIGLLVRADQRRIVQVLVNILSNAIKYSPEQSVVRIGASVEDDFASIFVQDSGPGIPEDYREKIFEPFKQVPGRTTERAASTGLGLSICKSIIEAHGGRVELVSSSQTGSCFKVLLPRVLELGQKN